MAWGKRSSLRSRVQTPFLDAERALGASPAFLLLLLLSVVFISWRLLMISRSRNGISCSSRFLGLLSTFFFALLRKKAGERTTTLGAGRPGGPRSRLLAGGAPGRATRSPNEGRSAGRQRGREARGADTHLRGPEYGAERGLRPS